MENLPSPKQEEIVLPLDIHIEDDCDFKYQTKDEISRFNSEDITDQIVIEHLESSIIHHSFIDPIAEYKKVIFSPGFQPYILYKDQIHQKLALHNITLVRRTHNQVILLIIITNNQVFHLFLLLLDWLH